MTWLVLFSLVLAVAYPAYVAIKNGELPESLSSLIYDLKGSQRGLWTLWIWAAGVSVGVAFTEGAGWLGFVLAAGFGFLGAMPLGEERPRAHYYLAVGVGVISQICVALTCAWWLLVWLLWLPLIAGAMAALNDEEVVEPVMNGGKSVLAVEMTCAATVYLSLLL